MQKRLKSVYYNETAITVMRAEISSNSWLTGSATFSFDNEEHLYKTKELAEKRKVEKEAQKQKDISTYEKQYSREAPLSFIKSTQNHKQKKQKKRSQYRINKSKIISKLQAYFNLEESKKRISFVTVSFPFKTADKHAKRLLNLWLTKLRKLSWLDSYLWVAERQKNNTIHFHLITNNYVNGKKWNALMRESLMNDYRQNNKIFSGYNPEKYNGVDVSKDRKTHRVVNFAAKNRKKSLSRYITKYVTKNSTKFNASAWYCSRDISALFTKVSELMYVDDIVRLMDNEYAFVFDSEMFSFFVPKKKLKTVGLRMLKEINQAIVDTFF